MADATPAYRVLIVDDEPLARQRIADLLLAQPDMEVVGEATQGLEAIEVLRALRPDIAFLDVQMPGLTGVEVAREVGPDRMPVTIFVTAYDHYALKAFDLAALDYLVKPFDDERFEQALDRAREVLSLRSLKSLQHRLATLLQDDAPARTEAPAPVTPPPLLPKPYLQRIPVDQRGQIRVVPVDEVTCITADGPYAEIHTAQDRFLIRERMQVLEDRLDPNVFFRIHRSTIVRLDCIESLLFNPGGDYAVRLQGGRRLKVSRGRRDALEQQLGLGGIG